METLAENQAQQLICRNPLTGFDRDRIIYTIDASRSAEVMVTLSTNPFTGEPAYKLAVKKAGKDVWINVSHVNQFEGMLLPVNTPTS